MKKQCKRKEVGTVFGLPGVSGHAPGLCVSPGWGTGGFTLVTSVPPEAGL